VVRSLAERVAQGLISPTVGLAQCVRYFGLARCHLRERSYSPALPEYILIGRSRIFGHGRRGFFARTTASVLFGATGLSRRRLIRSCKVLPEVPGTMNLSALIRAASARRRPSSRMYPHNVHVSCLCHYEYTAYVASGSFCEQLESTKHGHPYQYIIVYTGCTGGIYLQTLPTVYGIRTLSYQALSIQTKRGYVKNCIQTHRYIDQTSSAAMTDYRRLSQDAIRGTGCSTGTTPCRCTARCRWWGR
jgi:hypothetical protein